MTRYNSLTVAGIIAVSSSSDTTIHISPVYAPGRNRGSLIDVTFMNSNAAARDITIDIDGGAHVGTFVLQGKDERHLTFWQPSGTTLTAQATGSDVVAAGFVREF